MDTANNTYPALEFPASELSAFSVAADWYAISLKNGKIIHFQPDDTEHFHRWLISHGIRDSKKEIKEIEAVNKTDSEAISVGWLEAMV